MTAGKMSSQAGHAYTDTLFDANQHFPDRVKNYRNRTTGGSKVTLEARNENQLLEAYRAISALGIPCSIVVDSGHIMLPHFDGTPVITTLGIGPCTKSECHSVTKKFNCVRG